MSIGGFRRVLPLRTAVSTSAGLASAAINFLAAVEVAQLTSGHWAWVAILVAGVLIVLAATNFAELNGLYPTAAAIRVWIGRGWNDELARVASLVYASTVLLVMAADAFVLAQAFGQALPHVPGLVLVALVVVAISAANLQGIRVSGAIQDLNALVLLATLMAFSLAVLWHHPLPPSLPQASGPGGGFWQAVAVGVFIYVGFEWVTPLAEEFRDARSIPKGMLIALGLVAIAYALFTAALEALYPGGQGLAESFTPQLVVGRAAMGEVGYWWMMFLTLTTAGTTFNGGLSTASRFVYALARERTLPPGWARLNRRLVPARALLGLAALSLALAGVVVASRHYQLLINVGAGVESLMYALTAVLVLSLRRREPQRPRPFRALGGRYGIAAGGVMYLALGVGALLGGPGLLGPAGLLALLLALAWGWVRLGMPRWTQGRAHAQRL